MSVRGYGLMDNLTLSYDDNRLTGVSEAAADYDATGTFEYKRAKGSQYMYDANGSLVADKSRGIAYITYDPNNNPQTIYFTNGCMTKYTYSATGQKLRVVHYIAMPNVTWAFGVQPDAAAQSQAIFAGQTDYLLGGSLIVYDGSIRMVLFDGGYASATRVNFDTYNFSYIYYNRDHLGNNREAVNARGDVVQVTNYYPFGAPYADAAAATGSAMQQYKYNGKELDVTHGLNTYDYGARQLDPILGRWDRMDPLAEKYPGISPYVYCLNNPVDMIDPDGKEVFLTGNDKQRINLLGFLQKLSNDDLAMKQNGQVYIKSTGTRNTEKQLIVGTELVASLIGHKHKVTIQNTVKNSRTHSVIRGNSTNGKGTDANVFINTEKPIYMLVRDKGTGKSIYETPPTYITLGHELVHGLHKMNGTSKNYDDKSSYIFRDTDGKLKKTKARTEELETTGITSNSQFSENKLREEHKLNLRIQY